MFSQGQVGAQGRLARLQSGHIRVQRCRWRIAAHLVFLVTPGQESDAPQHQQPPGAGRNEVGQPAAKPSRPGQWLASGRVGYSAAFGRRQRQMADRALARLPFLARNHQTAMWAFHGMNPELHSWPGSHGGRRTLYSFQLSTCGNFTTHPWPAPPGGDLRRRCGGSNSVRLPVVSSFQTTWETGSIPNRMPNQTRTKSVLAALLCFDLGCFYRKTR